MKRRKGIVKGTPSAVLLSIAIHVLLFFLAGALVVFTVVKQKEVEFEPPKTVERPKMKLKKPKVKIKKSSKPKSTARIVTQAKRASMPNIELPEMSGMGDGIGGGIGGFDLMPDLQEASLFGGGQSIGNDFVGTFYDLNRNRSGRNIPMDPDKMRDIMLNFVTKGWSPSVLAPYYRSPRQLYATCFAIPPVHSTRAPAAFGEDDTQGYCWAAHYKGELVYPENITFRFWGNGDDFLLVRVDGKLVLQACWPQTTEPYFNHLWRSSSADSRNYAMGNNYAVVGDWITLKAGVPMPMEVLIGEAPGGLFCSMLAVEVKGGDYPRNPFKGGPTLPIFRTAELSRDLVETIHIALDPGDASVTNGPVFRDYHVPEARRESPAVAEESGPLQTPVVSLDEEARTRRWTTAAGETFNAEYKTKVGKQVLLKTENGKDRKMPLSELSAEDRTYVQLESPPDFDLTFSKTSTQIRPPDETPWLTQQPRPQRIFDFTFGVKMKPVGSFDYEQELLVEYFAYGDEVDGNNYLLLEYGQSRFSPDTENRGKHEFYGKKVRVASSAIRNGAPMRGEKYGGYLIVVTDARGKIIQHNTSNAWLFDHLENLRKVPVGKHFNKQCIRVGPPRPTREDRPTWTFR